MLIIPGKITLLADLYAFGSMISFTAAHVSVIVLRYREPDLERPFRAPLNIRVRGVPIPATAVLGALGTSAVWLVIVWYQPQSRLVGFAWMAAGLVGYVIYRKAKGYSLTRTVKAAALPATMQQDVVYDQLLVPVADTQVSDEMLVLACQLATERHSSIDALYVIEVPVNLPIDANVIAEREVAREVLDRAGHVADQFGVTLTPVVVTARSAGRAIVEQAKERRSEVIVLGSQSKRRIADKVFGRTIDYVLEHLPCEAIINVIPKSNGSVRLTAPPTIVAAERPAAAQLDEAPAPDATVMPAPMPSRKPEEAPRDLPIAAATGLSLGKVRGRPD